MSEPIQFFHRYHREIETEAIYGEKWLRWAYQSVLGKAALHALIKRPWFSQQYGRWADSEKSRSEVASFIGKYDVDPEEFLISPEAFGSFNEFFYRKLKPSARPITREDGAVCFPADGRHLVIEDLSQQSWIYVKNQKLDLAALLGGEQQAERFAKGSAVLSRLCPTDYHRFHFPLTGIPKAPELVNGPLFSVNPIALSRNLSYLWQNKRQITEVEDSPVGTYLFLEVGATNVGSIENTFQPQLPVKRGSEKGFFRFGGSMTITIFPENSFQPSEDLCLHSAEGREVYAKMGDQMGRVV